MTPREQSDAFQCLRFRYFFFNEWEIETLDVVANVNYEAWVRSFCRTRIFYGGCRRNYRGIVNWFIYFWQKTLTTSKVITISNIAMIILQNVTHKNDNWLDQFKSLERNSLKISISFVSHHRPRPNGRVEVPGRSGHV